MFHRIDLLLMALLSMGSTGGCVMLPLPPVGAQRGMEEIGSLEVGSATREQVQEALGDPDLTVGERYEIFDLSEENLNFFGDPGPLAGGRVRPDR